MNIIVNGLLLNGAFSGIQHSIERTLLSMTGMAGYDDIELLLPAGYNGMLCHGNFKQVRLPVGGRLQRIAWEHTILPSYLKNKKNSIYHAPGCILPVRMPRPSVITVHDLVPVQFPQWCRRSSVAYYQLALRGSVMRADRIIAVSETVKKDILARYPVSPAKIHVVYHGVGARFRRVCDADILQAVARCYRLPERYLLFVGNIEPRKNLEVLVRAFSILKQNYAEPVKLVIAGQKGWKYGPLYKAVQELRLADDIVFTGYVRDEHMPAIYSMADVFVFPSLYEGFGLPLLEAMACEVPVVISGAGALPEVAGEAALQVPANHIAALAGCMLQLLSDAGLRREYAARGLARARQFSWENTARGVLNVYNSLQHGI